MQVISAFVTLSHPGNVFKQNSNNKTTNLAEFSVGQQDDNDV